VVERTKRLPSALKMPCMAVSLFTVREPSALTE
jgi:hypothetical protein